MTPQAFNEKWNASELKERSAAQEHFLDLCRLLDEPTPAEADPKGNWYCFEKGATKTTGGKGFADVYKKGHFGWEYKGKHGDLDKAYAQLQRYAVALENPPLLVVCDTDRFVIHTNWTNSVHQVHEIQLNEITEPESLALLKSTFSDPEKLKPGKTRRALTEEAAAEFAELAKSLRARGFEAHQVAHFVNRLVFCMFAEDVGLLPRELFTRMLEYAQSSPTEFVSFVRDLFVAMKDGGRVGFEQVNRFNGGLFDDDAAFPLEKSEIETVLRAARLDWSDIDPSILGTLFERGLDPDKRSQLGAHYTDRDKIMMIVDPVIVEPLTHEWEEVKNRITKLMEKAIASKGGARTRTRNTAKRALDAFLERLSRFRVLDPACGSGNFLYLSLLALKDLEHRAQVEAEALGLPRTFPRVGPECLVGIEVNPYAAELARVSVWIGEIQWMVRNGFAATKDPILKPLDTIECRDALLNEDGTEADWPPADVIVGNPPFLGGKLLITYLGENYVKQTFDTFDGQVPREADLVCYWFEKASELVNLGKVGRAGLVATNSIRGGANREVLNHISSHGVIYDAWDDEPWVVDGAAVRVAIVSFAANSPVGLIRLDGIPVKEIYSDLTASTASGGVDLTKAMPLAENKSIAFMGDTKGGSFDVPGDLARQWLDLPLNPNGHPNSDVLKPWANGLDVTRRPRDIWIIDFGWEMGESEAALYEAPFSYVHEHVFPMRQTNRREAYRINWWRHVEPRQGMHSALSQRSFYISTPTVAKHRLFVRMPASVLADHQLIVIARDDATTFGILHSRFHELWSLRMGTSLEDRPRYTPTTTFGTFPFPEGLSPNLPSADQNADPRAQAIAEAGQRLNELRENWLNPPDLVRREPEVIPGYPDRLTPINEKAAAALKKRTLTNLYNERPAWLSHAHVELDEAVGAAYGWPVGLSDDQYIERLFWLNQERTA